MAIGLALCLLILVRAGTFKLLFFHKNLKFVVRTAPVVQTGSDQIKIKSSLYSPHYAEACNELRGPSPRLSAWATQLRRNIATMASRWRHCADLTGPGIEPQTSRTDSVRLAAELTAGSLHQIFVLTEVMFLFHTRRYHLRTVAYAGFFNDGGFSDVTS